MKCNMNLLKELNTEIENYDMKAYILQFRELYRDVEDELEFCKTKKHAEKWHIINKKIDEFNKRFFINLKEYLKIK